MSGAVSGVTPVAREGQRNGPPSVMGAAWRTVFQSHPIDRNLRYMRMHASTMVARAAG